MKLYKISRYSLLKTVGIRFHLLSKRLSKNTRKGVLIFLRSPKHFNIGKRKIFSFTGTSLKVLVLNFKIHTRFVLENSLIFLKFIPEVLKVNPVKKINSLRISVSTSIKWV